MLVLVRGVPGSGKSTYAALNYNTVYEADDFFVKQNGEYEWDFRFLPYAHERCLAATARALREEQHVCVANTFTKYWEIQRYLKLAEITGARVMIIHCTDQFDNVHGVPAEKIEEMRKRFDSNEKVLVKATEEFPNVTVVIATHATIRTEQPQAGSSEAQHQVSGLDQPEILTGSVLR